MQLVAATDVADDYLDSTDHIAYQYSNLIQPHVLFFNVDRQECLILNVSTNVRNWLGVNASEVVGQVLADNLFPGISAVLKGMGERASRSAQVFSQCVKDCEDNPLLCRVVGTPTRCMVELEFEEHECNVDVDTQQLNRYLMDGIQTLNCESTVEETVGIASRNLRELLGYERGMCYRFDELNNGEVIAESTAGTDIKRYLGLRFPARDIPRTAREMLIATPLRTTLDQRLECHQIYPCRDPHSQQYVDLTHVRGRGAAGSCREFYLNMDIRSTLVLPLIVENKLWGLLSFHDHKVRRVCPVLDEHLQSIAKCVSTSIERKLRFLSERARMQGLQVVSALSEVDPTSTEWLRYIQSRLSDLKQLFSCDGFILRVSGEVLATGQVPDAADRNSFTDLIWDLAQGRALCTSCLTDHSEDLAKYSHIAAGVIAIPLSADFEDIAIWLRPEQKQTLHWAGDPMSNIDKDASGHKRLCLRESFDVWIREVKSKCLAWTKQEHSVATSACMQLGLLALSWHAAQANHAKTQFLSCMSHEIRTPMTAILGYVSLLKEQCQSGSQNITSCDYIEIIERNSEHLLSVIDDILNLAKIEAGKLTTEEIPIALNSLLKDIFALMKVQADVKRLAYSIDLDTPIPQVIYSDPVRLRQILLNLLGNGFKFTERGKVTLKVGYDSSIQKIYFDVTDTGIGLTELQISRLFNAFSQADASTTRRFGGSGLGLQICKTLAQLLGGDVTVRSEIGVGSSFRVTVASGCSGIGGMINQLEFSQHIADKHEPNIATHGQANTALPSLNEVRIMLLEDGEDNQRLLRHFLINAGAEVTIFSNGKLGIEAVTTDGKLDGPLQTPFPFDIVLTDIQMPELDGYSTTQLLREKGCNHPIIALTAFAMEGNTEDCLRAGCSDYLSKPVKRQSLLEVCSKWSPANLGTPKRPEN